MRKIAPFAAAWALLISGIVLVGAQTYPGYTPGVFQDTNALTSGGTAPSCTGVLIGNCVSGAWMYVGGRCYSTSYSGNALDIVDGASGTTTGTRMQCSGGTMSALVSASACTFVTGNACSALATTCATSCVVKTFYDQSGNTNCSSAACNFTSTFAINPIVVQSCSGSLLCFSFANTQYTRSPTATTLAQPFTFSFVAIRTGNFSANNTAVSAGAMTTWSFFGSAGNNMRMSNISNFTNETATDNVLHTFQQVYNGASSSDMVDATAHTSLNPGATSMSGQLEFGSVNTNGSQLTGKIMEWAVYSGALSTTNQTLLHQSECSAWGSTC